MCRESIEVEVRNSTLGFQTVNPIFYFQIENHANQLMASIAKADEKFRAL